MTAQNREIEKLGSKKDKANSTIDEKQLEIKQLEHQVSKSQSDAKDAEKRVKKIHCLLKLRKKQLTLLFRICYYCFKPFILSLYLVISFHSEM